MASGDGTSDGLGREEHTRTKNLGKATQGLCLALVNSEAISFFVQVWADYILFLCAVCSLILWRNIETPNKASAALESHSGPETNRNPKILSTINVAQDLTLSTGKQALQDWEYGLPDHSMQSSTSWPIGSFRETDSQTHGRDPAQSNFEGVAASVAPVGAAAVDPNVGSVVALLGEASLEPNGAPLVVLNDVGRAESSVGPIAVLHGVALAQSNVAIIVAPLGEILAKANIAPNVALPAPAVVAPRPVAPVAPDVAPQAQRNGAPPAQAHPNAALIVAPPGVALAHRNAAAIVAPPTVVVLDVNRGLKRSRLKPLRICEIGSEGHFWPKLP